jgi:2-polyprenyl-3-methyl-5-hydroxy-6-metoxy-1,4-benzoquinol methylase
MRQIVRYDRAVSEVISCPLCVTSDSTPVIHDNGFTGRQCARCGLIFVSPRPTEQEMAELYHEGDAYLPPEFFLATANTLAGRLGARSAVSEMLEHSSGGSLLEIGPGNGAVLAEAANRGFDVVGVELNDAQAEFIRTHRGLRCFSSLDDAEALGPFDVIYHRDVISHFYDPLAQFERLHAMLRPGGLHVFETGNFGDIDHRYFAHVRSFQYPDHLFFYSERSLHELLRRTGYEHVHTYRFSTRPEQLLRSGIRRTMGLMRRGRADTTENGASEPAPDRAPPEPATATVPSRAGILARDALDVTYYGIRHTLGAVTARARDPQTLTVVARTIG